MRTAPSQLVKGNPRGARELLTKDSVRGEGKWGGCPFILPYLSSSPPACAGLIPEVPRKGATETEAQRPGGQGCPKSHSSPFQHYPIDYCKNFHGDASNNIQHMPVSTAIPCIRFHFTALRRLIRVMRA